MDTIVYDILRAGLAVIIISAVVYGVYFIGVEIVKEGVISAHIQ